jgi:hypothetical protein
MRRLFITLIVGALITGAFFIGETAGIGRERADTIARLEALKNTTNEQLALIRSATDPNGCIARRNAYTTLVAVLQIVNDNRRIHHVKTLPIPPGPPTCPTKPNLFPAPQTTQTTQPQTTKTVIAPGPTVTQTVSPKPRKKVRAHAAPSPTPTPIPAPPPLLGLLGILCFLGLC